MDAFHILTEFRFEVGSAVANSEHLQNAIHGISNSAEHAMGMLQRFGYGLAAHMGLGAGSLTSVLYESIQASEKFDSTQRKLANLFLSNPERLAGGAVSFERAMSVSSDIMDEILAKSRKFSLSASAFTEMTTSIGAALVAMGAAGTNLRPAQEIARGVLKTAPALGFNVQDAQSQVVSMLMGRGHIQDIFVSRITQDTKVFQELLRQQKHGGPGTHLAGGALSAFNALPIEKRVDVMRRALLQFASSSEIVEANAHSLTQQMQVLKDNMIGMYSVFRPIGRAFSQVLAPMLSQLNIFLQTQAVEISNSISRFIRTIVSDPENLLRNVMQARKLKHDVGLATHLWETYAAVEGVLQAMRWLGIQGRAFSSSLSLLGSVFSFFGRGLRGIFTMFMDFAAVVFGTTTMFGTFVAMLDGLVILVSRAVFPIALLTLFFQLISRSIAIAQIADAKAMIEISPRMIKALADLKIVFDSMIAPFTALFDAAAEAGSPLFKMSLYISGLVWLIEALTSAIIHFQAGFQGITFAILEFFNQFTRMTLGATGGYDFSKVGEAYNAGIDEMIERNMRAIEKGEGPISNAITNINGDININNAFKEQMEPDRVAFTLVEQIKKTAANPKQALGGSLATGLVGR